ncbi:delta-aminolevulinic acid dehydratase [Abditibacteriota bacterium]|nr:delta-aminolevulinic acid dehydratase [Abditibacteriota bacterium]
MSFPASRPRRLRRTPTLRQMVRENHVLPSDLIAPLFVCEGEGIEVPISSLPGQFRFSVDRTVEAAKRLWEVGVPSVILFGIVSDKDEMGSGSYNAGGPVPRAIEAIKEALPSMVVIADTCACEYTSHGHCGILRGLSVDNDATLELLARAAVCYARAGADIIAPSDMMDGRVAAIRRALDNEGFVETPIMSYAAKFAGAFYGPFREAADSAPAFGDRRSYQMDIANRREALREMQLDIEEGADFLLIKPALFCLDLVRDARERFDAPLCVYNVSSEYAMIKAAGQMGWIDEERLIDETLISFKRAGADLIITYHALEWAQRFAQNV